MNQAIFTQNAPNSFAKQLERATDKFIRYFNRKPTKAATAPGRVNLIGEHTDYNDGFVMPMAIEQKTLILAAPREDNQINARSTAQENPASFSISGAIEKGEPFWSNYVRGPLAGCKEKGLDIPGFDCLIDTTVPVGAGLSSSASIEVAVATLAEAMSGQLIDPIEKALLCQRAEHEFAGVPCGIMDQFICALAKENAAMLLDCRTHETKMAPLDDPAISVLIIDSNVKHELNDGEYAKRRTRCEQAAKALGIKALRDGNLQMLENSDLDEMTKRRARHVITENERTVAAAQAAQMRNWQKMGELMIESHNSLRDNFEVSCKELDILVELALQEKGKSVFGSRMTGGGFGGCTVSLVKSVSAEAIAATITDKYQKQTGITTRYFITKPGAGARQVQL